MLPLLLKLCAGKSAKKSHCILLRLKSPITKQVPMDSKMLLVWSIKHFNTDSSRGDGR